MGSRETSVASPPPGRSIITALVHTRVGEITGCEIATKRRGVKHAGTRQVAGRVTGTGEGARDSDAVTGLAVGLGRRRRNEG